MAEPRGTQGASPALDDDVIELTDVVDELEGEAETLIELPPELRELDTLDFKTLLGEETQDADPSLAAAPEVSEPEDILADFLEPPTPPGPADIREEQMTSADEDSLAGIVESHTVEQIVDQVMTNFDDARLRQLIEPLLREIAERLCRELFPAIAETIIIREIEALKQGAQEDG